MHAVRQPTASATVLLAGGPLPVRTRPFLLAPVQRQPIDRIFAEAIVLCMNEGRRPARHEVQAVAARIWNDIQVGSPKIPWDDIVPGCGRHRRIVAAARAALGDARSGGKPP